MTLEARKHAFKKSIACGPTTIVLTAILMYFSMAKAYAANPADLVGVAVSLGGTVTITSWICCFLQYLIVGKEFKAQFEEGGEMLPAMGKREEQIQFFRWVPGKWWAYVLLMGVVAGVTFGTGIPCYLASWGINPGGIGRLGYAILSGIINGCGTWWAVYLSQIYLVQFFWEKAAAAQAAGK